MRRFDPWNPLATLGVGQFRPAAIIVFIVAVTGALESYTLDKKRMSIRNLLDLTPRMAMIQRGEDEKGVIIGAILINRMEDLGIIRGLIRQRKNAEILKSDMAWKSPLNFGYVYKNVLQGKL